MVVIFDPLAITDEHTFRWGDPLHVYSVKAVDGDCSGRGSRNPIRQRSDRDPLGSFRSIQSAPSTSTIVKSRVSTGEPSAGRISRPASLTEPPRGEMCVPNMQIFRGQFRPGALRAGPRGRRSPPRTAQIPQKVDGRPRKRCREPGRPSPLDIRQPAISNQVLNPADAVQVNHRQVACEPGQPSVRSASDAPLSATRAASFGFAQANAALGTCASVKAWAARTNVLAAAPSVGPSCAACAHATCSAAVQAPSSNTTYAPHFANAIRSARRAVSFDGATMRDASSVPDRQAPHRATRARRTCAVPRSSQVAYVPSLATCRHVG